MTVAQLKRSLHTFHLKLILVKGTFALYNQFWDVTDESKIVARLNRRQNSLKLFTLVISQNQIILIYLKKKFNPQVIQMVLILSDEHLSFFHSSCNKSYSSIQVDKLNFRTLICCISCALNIESVRKPWNSYIMWWFCQLTWVSSRCCNVCFCVRYSTHISLSGAYNYPDSNLLEKQITIN